MTSRRVFDPTRTDGQLVSFPPRPQAPASHTDICDALLAFCERATEISKTLGRALKSNPIALTPYIHNLTRMREGSPEGSGIDSTALAKDICALVTTKLGAHLSTPDAQYWMAITTAFAASLQTAMPDFSKLVADTQSDIIHQHAQSTLRYRERYD